MNPTVLGLHAHQGASSCVDQVGADSFPASDPPSWTPAVARPAPPNLPDGVASGAPAEGLATRAPRTAPITETATAMPRVDERPRMRCGSWYQSQLIPLGGMLLVFVYAAWQVSLLVEQGAVAR